MSKKKTKKNQPSIEGEWYDIFRVDEDAESMADSDNRYFGPSELCYAIAVGYEHACQLLVEYKARAIEQEGKGKFRLYKCTRELLVEV